MTVHHHLCISNELAYCEGLLNHFPHLGGIRGLPMYSKYVLLRHRESQDLDHFDSTKETNNTKSLLFFSSFQQGLFTQQRWSCKGGMVVVILIVGIIRRKACALLDNFFGRFIGIGSRGIGGISISTATTGACGSILFANDACSVVEMTPNP
jgi:hypothetical protein